MTSETRIALATAGSLALLLAAFAFQYIGGLAPCSFCLYQRWPHVVAVGLGVLALAFGWQRAFAALAVLAMLAGAGIGIFHTGMERDWWEGPASCTGGGSPADIGGGALLDLSAPINVVMCDEVQWSLFGLSMASWNALASLALAFIWLSVAVQNRPRGATA